MAMGALWWRPGTVPEDVSVVGFDDIPEGAFSQPPLTTIRQDFGALGAVRLIVSAIGGEAPPSTLVPPRLVTRHSTATVAARPPRLSRLSGNELANRLARTPM